MTIVWETIAIAYAARKIVKSLSSIADNLDDSSEADVPDVIPSTADGSELEHPEIFSAFEELL